MVYMFFSLNYSFPFKRLIFRTRYRDLWKICKYFTQFNTFVYQDKRIYIELDDKRKIYSVKVMSSNEICLRVPLKSYLRVRTARMSAKIIRDAMIILEEQEMNKEKENEKNQRDQNQLIERIVKIEKSLKTMEKLLRVLLSKKSNKE